MGLARFVYHLYSTATSSGAALVHTDLFKTFHLNLLQHKFEPFHRMVIVETHDINSAIYCPIVHVV